MGDRLRIVFTGDISFSKYMAEGWKGEGCISREVDEYLRAADDTVANLESPMTDSQSKDGRFIHTSPTAAGRYLAEHTIRIWNIANNHTADLGETGLMDTLHSARDSVCSTLGAGLDEDEAFRPVILGETVKVGLLSMVQSWQKLPAAAKDTPGVAMWNRTKEIRKRVEALRTQVDWIVFVVHGGGEFCDVPMPYMRQKFMELLELGADVIVAHHPHVVQPYEYVDGKLILYSLGNFIFDTDFQREFPHTSAGVLAGLEFTKDAFTLDHMAYRIDRQSHRIVPGPTPAVFREINAEGYGYIWPLAARGYHRNMMKKEAVLGKRWVRSKLLTHLHVARSWRKKEGRTVQLGRWRSYFRKWDRPEYRELFDYLRSAE
ncbi:MAG: CapA family protein [Oscillospiraceae bacterium]|nr:CapA family protein [Oscillospiraceae bacterium]